MSRKSFITALHNSATAVLLDLIIACTYKYLYKPSLPTTIPAEVSRLAKTTDNDVKIAKQNAVARVEGQNTTRRSQVTMTVTITAGEAEETVRLQARNRLWF
jgi:hypothetical protein